MVPARLVRHNLNIIINMLYSTLYGLEFQSKRTTAIQLRELLHLVQGTRQYSYERSRALRMWKLLQFAVRSNTVATKAYVQATVEKMHANKRIEHLAQIAAHVKACEEHVAQQQQKQQGVRPTTKQHTPVKQLSSSHTAQVTERERKRQETLAKLEHQKQREKQRRQRKQAALRELARQQEAERKAQIEAELERQEEAKRKAAEVELERYKAQQRKQAELEKRRQRFVQRMAEWQRKRKLLILRKVWDQWLRMARKKARNQRRRQRRRAKARQKNLLRRQQEMGLTAGRVLRVYPRLALQLRRWHQRALEVEGSRHNLYAVLAFRTALRMSEWTMRHVMERSRMEHQLEREEASDAAAATAALPTQSRRAYLKRKLARRQGDRPPPPRLEFEIRNMVEKAFDDVLFMWNMPTLSETTFATWTSNMRNTLNYDKWNGVIAKLDNVNLGRALRTIWVLLVNGCMSVTSLVFRHRAVMAYVNRKRPDQPAIKDTRQVTNATVRRVFDRVLLQEVPLKYATMWSLRTGFTSVLSYALQNKNLGLPRLHKHSAGWNEMREFSPNFMSYLDNNIYRNRQQAWSVASTSVVNVFVNLGVLKGACAARDWQYEGLRFLTPDEVQHLQKSQT